MTGRSASRPRAGETCSLTERGETSAAEAPITSTRAAHYFAMQGAGKASVLPSVRSKYLFLKRCEPAEHHRLKRKTHSRARNRYAGKSLLPLLLVAFLLVGRSSDGQEAGLTAATIKKLDPQLVLALKQSRGQPPFDQATTLRPDIPIRQGDRVLVDITGTVSKSLLDYVVAVGGQVINGSATTTSFRAMVPLPQLESFASRADVESITPAQLAVTSRAKPPVAK